MAQGRHQGGRGLWQELLGHKAMAEQGRHRQVGKSPKPRSDPPPQTNQIKHELNQGKPFSSFPSASTKLTRDAGRGRGKNAPSQCGVRSMQLGGREIWFEPWL